MSTQGRGRPPSLDRAATGKPRPSVRNTYRNESKCPIDGRPVPLGFGRPRTYCTDDCRREAAHRRHELDALTAELADARDQIAAGASASYWRGRIAHLEREVSEQRDRTPEALRP